MAQLQFSLANLFLIILWVAIALGLWLVSPRWALTDPPVSETMVVLSLASLGAATGEIFKKRLIGAAIGAGIMVSWYCLLSGMQRLLELLTPI